MDVLFVENRQKQLRILIHYKLRFSDCLCGEYIIDRKVLEDYGEYNKILKSDEDKKTVFWILKE